MPQVLKRESLRLPTRGGLVETRAPARAGVFLIMIVPVVVVSRKVGQLWSQWGFVSSVYYGGVGCVGDVVLAIVCCVTLLWGMLR